MPHRRRSTGKPKSTVINPILFFSDKKQYAIISGQRIRYAEINRSTELLAEHVNLLINPINQYQDYRLDKLDHEIKITVTGVLLLACLLFIFKNIYDLLFSKPYDLPSTYDAFELANVLMSLMLFAGSVFASIKLLHYFRYLQHSPPVKSNDAVNKHNSLYWLKHTDRELTQRTCSEYGLDCSHPSTILSTLDKIRSEKKVFQSWFIFTREIASKESRLHKLPSDLLFYEIMPCLDVPSKIKNGKR